MRLLQVCLHPKVWMSLLPLQCLVSVVYRDAGTTALSAAIKQRRSAAVQILLSRGADLDRINAHGVTPLAVAQVQGALKVYFATNNKTTESVKDQAASLI